MPIDPIATQAYAAGVAGVSSVNGDFKEPDNVILGPLGLRALYDQLKENHGKRCFNAERIQGMLDGNPPYNPKKMAAAGLSDMTNVSFQDGSAIFDSVALAFWSLFNNVETIVDFTLSLTNDEGMNTVWAKILSQEWDKAVRSWPDFRKRMAFHQTQLISFGVNALVWPDERDWRFKVVNYKNFLVPDQAENSMECLTKVVLEHKYTAQFLWSMFEKAQANPSGAWDHEALGHILVQLAHTGEGFDKESKTACFEIQKKLRNGDWFYEQLYNDDITLASVLIREYDDKISHYMLHPYYDTEEFVYFQDRQYSRFQEALTYFTFRPGEETIHGNKGLGHKMFTPVLAMAQLDCSALDQAKRGGSLLIKSGPTRGRDERQVKFVHGGVIDIGEAEIVQNSMGSNLAQTIQTSAFFQAKVFANNNISGRDPGTKDRNIAKSAAEARIEATNEANVQKNIVEHYYADLDDLFAEITRKMLRAKKSYPGFEYVEAWKEACVARGVPEDIFDLSKAKLKPNGLPDFMEVAASRSSGAGSQVADQQSMRFVLSFLPALGERGRIAAIQDAISAFRGYRYVPRYFPPEDRTQQPTSEDTLASIENNQLAEGKQVTVSPDNVHAVHAINHIRLMRDYMQAYQENPQAQLQDGTAILQKVDQVFSVAGPHLVQHLFYVSQDGTRTEQFREMNAQWAILANFGDMIKNNAARQREAEARREQERQQALAEQEAQNTPQHIKARGDIQLKQQKLEAGIERDRQRDSFKFALEREKIERNDELQALKTVNEIARKNAKELSEVEGEET